MTFEGELSSCTSHLASLGIGTTVGDQDRVLAQHWFNQLEDLDLGPFNAFFGLFNEIFDGIWTCFMVHE